MNKVPANARLIFRGLFFFIVLIVSGVSGEIPLQKPILPGIFLDGAMLSGPDLPRKLEALSKAGFKEVSADLPWNLVEPKRGRFLFSPYDRFVSSAHENHLEVMFILGFCPSWAAGEDAGETGDERARMMPNRLKDWADFVERASLHYKGKVRLWQIWEFPSIDNFRGTTGDYEKLLMSAYPILKRADPKAVIFAAEPGGPDLGFIASLFREPWVRFFDGVSLNPELDDLGKISEYLNAVYHDIQGAHPHFLKVFAIGSWKYSLSDVAAYPLTAVYAPPIFSPKEFDAFFSPLPAPMPAPAVSGPVCVEFARNGEVESGLYTRKYRGMRMADPAITHLGGTYSADLDPQQNPFLYADVDDRYIFFNQGKFPVEIKIIARGEDTSRDAGFNIMYDSPRGHVFTPWMRVKPGTGWTEYDFKIADANFADKEGFDFRVSDLGSEQDVYVASVCVRRGQSRQPRITNP